MGFLDKLMFWKKKDEFADIGLGERGAAPGMNLGLGPDFGSGADLSQGYGMQPSPGMPSMQQPSFQPPSFSSPSFSPPPQSSRDYAADKNLEVISSKLDALRAAIESINQRLANIEAIARGEEDKRYRGRW